MQAHITEVRERPGSGVLKEVVAMMGWYVGDHMTGWGWVGMALSTVLFVGLLLVGGLLLVRATRQSERALTPPSPEQLLAERFARGDIDEDEYRRRLATLTDAGALRR